MKNSTRTYCTILIAMLFLLFTKTVNAQDGKIKKILKDIGVGKNADAKKMLDELDSDSRYQSDLFFWYARTLYYKNMALASEANINSLEEARKSFNKLVEIDKQYEPSPNVKIISELRKELFEGKNALKVATNSSPAKVVEAIKQTDVSEADKTVSLVVTGQGKTPDEAKQSALRSAIEQAFGAFISSKTEILNDQVMADQITSVANGNIQKYDVLSEDQLPDGRWAISLKALVSVSKLTSFVESKGIAIEIKGGLFAINIKQQILNEQAESKAIEQLIEIMNQSLKSSFDYTIKSSEPKSLDGTNNSWIIPMQVDVTCNKNISFCADYVTKTLAALTLNDDEVVTYKSLNKEVYWIVIVVKGDAQSFALRNQISVDKIIRVIDRWEAYTKLFTVQAGIDAVKCEWNGSVLSLRSKGGSIFFPASGDNAATYWCDDKRTLSQIEQMTGYTITPKY
jgi:hypothetical protein